MTIHTPGRRLMHEVPLLDRSLWMQYFIWISHVFRGNLGQSFTTHQTTTSILANSFPIDIELIIFSQLMAFAVALPMAITASRRPNSDCSREGFVWRRLHQLSWRGPPRRRCSRRRR